MPALGQANETQELTTPTNDDAIYTIFPDGLMPTECLVQFGTQTVADDSRSCPIFAVHPIDGFATALKPLAAKLTVPFYGLQCIAEIPFTSIADLAEFYIKQIKSVQQTGPYIIVGYSFGASVAFEMGALLESADEKVTLVLIDGSPKYVNWAIELIQQREEYKFGNSNTSVDNTIAGVFLSAFGDFDYAQTIKQLDGIASLDSKLEYVSEIIAQKSKYTVDIVQSAAISFSKKVKATLNYTPKRKITTSNVILFKIPDNDAQFLTDYGLSEVNLLEIEKNFRLIICFLLFTDRCKQSRNFHR